MLVTVCQDSTHSVKRDAARSEVDHYRTLQVTRDAEPEVIERAYRALSMKHHPDVAKSPRDATRRMQRINEAYSVLRDPARRRAYDADLAPEGSNGWDCFLEDGLIGLFRDRIRTRSAT